MSGAPPIRPALVGAIQRRKAFTLVELLVACAVLALIVGLLLSVISKSSDLWRSASNKVDAYQAARSGFDGLTRQLSQAVLNTYLDYSDPNNPTNYIRKSELHFRTGAKLAGSLSQAVFFQVPAERTGNVANYGGMDSLLNACGFFIDYTADSVPDSLKSRLTSRSHFRLMQWIQNTEELSVYDPDASKDAWYTNALAEAIPIADNVIALILWPRLSSQDTPPAGWTDSYEYDSRQSASGGDQPIKQNQLPPMVQVTMVAIDDRSVVRLGDQLKPTIDAALQGLFQGDPRDLTDLQTLEGRLNTARIDYRVFTTDVSLKESKWSKQ